jgi:hypothetical protein
MMSAESLLGDDGSRAEELHQDLGDAVDIIGRLREENDAFRANFENVRKEEEEMAFSHPHSPTLTHTLT